MADYCENCDCVSCSEARHREEDAAELKAMFNYWNWNLSPTECAQDLIERDLEPDGIEQDMLAFGFSQAEVYDVQAAYDALA